MDAVHTILDQCDTTVTEMAPGERYEIDPDADAQERLVIEKIDAERLSVAHYYTRHGDLMSDPEVVFRLEDNHRGGTLTPIRYTDHSVVPHHHEHDPEGIDIYEFLDTWNENLHNSGYVEAAGQDQQGGIQ